MLAEVRRVIRNRVGRRNHQKQQALRSLQGFVKQKMLTESLNVIYYHALFTFLDRPKQSSLLSSAKSRRHLVPSRNKALINLMMSLLLVVLILGYAHLWLMLILGQGIFHAEITFFLFVKKLWLHSSHLLHNHDVADVMLDVLAKLTTSSIVFITQG